MTEDHYKLNKNLKIETLKIGNNKILIIDNLLENPDLMVEYASNHPFSPYPGYKNQKGYPGIRLTAPGNYSYNLTMYLEPIIKNEFEVPKDLGIRKSVCAFSLTTMKPQNLGPLQRTPHFDSSTPHHIAVLLYLCDEKHGGTAFYRHNSTGLDHITADTKENYLDIYYDELNAKTPKPEYFDNSNEFFTKIGMIKAKFNRLAIYKGCLLHNPVINPSLSLDTNPVTGRLTVNTFYDF